MAGGTVVRSVARGAPLRPILSQRHRSVEGEPAGGMRHVRTVTARARLGRVAIEAGLRLGGAGGPVRRVPALRVRHRETVALLTVQFGVVAAAAHVRTLLVHQPSVRGKESDGVRHADPVAILTDPAVRRSHGSCMTGTCVARQARDALSKVHRVREGLAVLKRERRKEVGVASQTGAVRDDEIRLERSSHLLRRQRDRGRPVAGRVQPSARRSHYGHDPQSAHECKAPERAGNQKNTGHRTSSRV